MNEMKTAPGAENTERAGRRTGSKDLASAMAQVYAEAAGQQLTNAELFERLVDAKVTTRDELDDRRPVGRSGMRHSIAQRALRFRQQDLKREGLLERDPTKRGVWRLTTIGKQKFVRPEPRRVLLAYSTRLGLALWGAAEDVASRIDQPVHLLLTSPPYPLAKPRAYGNPPIHEYIDFILRSLEPLLPKLVNGASLVLNLSQDIFNPGSPARSTVLERLTIACEDKLGLHLIDRICWHNPSKMPAPVRYASMNRTHLNFGWEPCLWFSNDPSALRSDNRRVLIPHTERHKQLMAKGGEARSRVHSDGAYRLRPGSSFAKETEGRIPRNVLTLGHACAGQQAYKEAAKALGLPAHGAPFPEAFVRFFVEFMTRRGDHCVDLFSGSGTLGTVCEDLGRTYTLGELFGENLRGAAERVKDAEGFELHDDLVDGLRLKFHHQSMEGQTSLNF